MKRTPLLFLVTLIVTLIAFASYQLGKRSGNTLNVSSSVTSESGQSVRPPSAHLANDEETKLPTKTLDSEEVKRIFDIETPEERSTAYREYLKNLTPDNALQMLADLEAMRPSQKKMWLMGMLFAEWGKVAGSVALDHALHYEGQQGLHFQSSAIEGWAGNQPVEAWKTMMDLSNNGFVWMPRFTQTVSKIAQKDLALAVQLIQDIDEPFRQPFLFQSIVNSAADKGEMPQLLAQIETVEDKKKQGTYLETLFKEWGQFDNDTSLSAANNLGDPELVASAMKGMMNGWALNDGQGALEYAIQNSEDPLFKEIAVGVAKEWVRHATHGDVDAVISTVNSAPNKNQIMDGIIYQLAMANPDSALQFAESADNASSQGKNITAVLWSMSKIDPARVDAYYRSIPNDEVRFQSTGAATQASIYSEAPAEETLSLLSTYTNGAHRDTALEQMVDAATYGDNISQSGDLRVALTAEVEANESLQADVKKRLLDQLKSVDE
jgi:hypothetical protein